MHFSSRELDAKSTALEGGLFLVSLPSLFSLPLIKWPINSPHAKAAYGDYAPVTPSSGKRVAERMRACKVEASADTGIDMMTNFFIHERPIIFTIMCAYDQQNPDECKQVGRLFMSMHEEAKRQ
jgi:hypothetical protein